MNKIMLFYARVRCSCIFTGCCAFLALSLVLYFLPDKQTLYVDEQVHYHQIASFFNGTFKMEEQPSMLPGYHVLMGIISMIFNTLDITFFRFISVLIASITIGYFAKLYAHVNSKINIAKTIIFAFFPVIAPFFFLIYTDMLCLLLFMAALYTGLKKNYQMSAFLGILNLAVRQNTFFWYIFSFILIFISHYPDLTIKNLTDYFKRSWVYIIGFILFAGFVVLNKGIAIGEKNMHPGISVNLGNIFFFLFLTGLLTFPLKIWKIEWPTRRQYMWVTCLFVLYWFGFEVTHPYNLFDTDYFLRNDVLRYAANSTIGRILFFLPVLAGMFVFFQFYKSNKQIFILYAIFGTLSLLPSWLIEQRYYFIHYMLLFLYGLNGEIKYFRVAIVYIIIDIFFLYGIFTNWFFL